MSSTSLSSRAEIRASLERAAGQVSGNLRRRIDDPHAEAELRTERIRYAIVGILMDAPPLSAEQKSRILALLDGVPAGADK